MFFLDAGVQEADAGAQRGDGLAVHLEDHPEHTVGRRVLGTHVDDDLLVAAVRLATDDVVPVAALGDVDGADRLVRHE